MYNSIKENTNINCLLFHKKKHNLNNKSKSLSQIGLGYTNKTELKSDKTEMTFSKTSGQRPNVPTSTLVEGKIDTSSLSFRNIEPHIYKSKSGMTLNCIPDDEATVISLGIYITIGSLDEDNVLGVAHFLEHMVFKGTGKYPGNTLVERLDLLGTSYNAATSYEYTNYYMYGLPQFQDELITILLDMFFDPDISPESIETEKNVILEEYNAKYDSKYFIQYINLLSMITNEKNKLYGRPLLGTRESINKIDKKILKNFREKYADHSKVTITVSGKFNKDYVKDLIEKLINEYDSTFGTFNSYNGLIKIDQKNFKTDFILTTVKPKLSNRFRFNKIISEQTSATIMFPSWKSFTKKNIYLSIVSIILTDRLYKKLRIDNGLVYGIYADYNTYNTFGMFFIELSLSHDNLYDAMKFIFDELINIYMDGITESELIRITNLNLKSMLIDYQNQLTFFGIYTTSIAYNYRYNTPDDIIKIFNTVDINIVHDDIIKKIINPKQMYISMSGSVTPDNRKMTELFRYFQSKFKNVTK